jgi:hypothetical protein
MFLGEIAGRDGESGSTRDAVNGLGAIADALHQGLGSLDGPGKCRFCLSDAIAIALAWLLFVSVIFYPALQLLAFTAGILFFSGKSLFRLVLGPSAIQPTIDAVVLRRDRVYTAA